MVATAVGYTQGTSETPSYEEVCSGSTGHTEAVQARVLNRQLLSPWRKCDSLSARQVLFDPSDVTYARLCDLFWERLGDNRYLLNQVGNDRGTQCEGPAFSGRLSFEVHADRHAPGSDRHGIYTHSEAQAAVAQASKEKLESDDDKHIIHTELMPAQQ